MSSNFSHPVRVLEVIDTAPGRSLRERLRLRLTEPPTLGALEVRIGMLAMSILPADLLQMRGQYGLQPALPYVPGHEGVAVVLEAGPGVSDIQPGDRVLPMGVGGLWADERVVKRRSLVAVAAEADLLQQAMLTANPATAWILLQHERPIQAGQWVIQNAANSAVGQCVRQIADHLGLQVLNVVRRPEAIEAHSKALWLVDEGQDPQAFRRRVRDLIGAESPVLALDAIGGRATSCLAASLADSGRLVSYGLLSAEPAQVAAHDLIFRGIEMRGFWLARWFADPAHREAAREVYPALMKLVHQGALHMQVEKVYDLDQWAEALAHAARPHRGGKVLLSGWHCPPA